MQECGEGSRFSQSQHLCRRVGGAGGERWMKDVWGGSTFSSWVLLRHFGKEGNEAEWESREEKWAGL